MTKEITVTAQKTGPSTLRIFLPAGRVLVTAEQGRQQTKVTVTGAESADCSETEDGFVVKPNLATAGNGATPGDVIQVSRGGSVTQVARVRGRGNVTQVGGQVVIGSGNVVQNGGGFANSGIVIGNHCVQTNNFGGGASASSVSYPGDAVVEAFVPAMSTVIVNGQAVDVEMTGDLAHVSVSTSAGDVLVESTNSANISTTSGSIDISGLGTLADLQAVSGDVNVRVRGNAIVNAGTVSGNITIRVDEGSRVRTNLRSTSGIVQVI